MRRGRAPVGTSAATRRHPDPDFWTREAEVRPAAPEYVDLLDSDPTTRAAGLAAVTFWGAACDVTITVAPYWAPGRPIESSSLGSADFYLSETAKLRQMRASESWHPPVGVSVGIESKGAARVQASRHDK
jgi:hypothetical protein